jgi:hypothetical protein
MKAPNETEKEELRLWIAQADSMVSMIDCGWSGHEIAKFFEIDSESVLTTVREIFRDYERRPRGAARGKFAARMPRQMREVMQGGMRSESLC